MSAIDSAVTGSDWTDVENDLLVADYFAMRNEQLAGHPPVKRRRYATLGALIGRAPKAIEWKHRNVSFVLESLGQPWTKGLRPADNAQFHALVAAVERYFAANPAALEPDIPKPILIPSEDPFVAPPPLQARPDDFPDPIRRLVSKIDPVARDARNRALGKRGEEFVLEVEKRRLFAAGREDLVDDLCWESQVHGDGAGYDIRSFDPASGDERLIEVKSTCGESTMPFFVSRNEEQLSLERPKEFRLYRVFDLAIRPRIFAICPPLRDFVRLETAAWKATFG